MLSPKTVRDQWSQHSVLTNPTLSDKFSPHSAFSGNRARIARLLYHKYSEVVIALIAILNFVLIIFDTDLEAEGSTAPVWLEVCSWACYAAYCFELCLRIYVERCHIFSVSWNWLDMGVVTLGAAEYIFDNLLGGMTFFSVRFLRIFRCLRLVRIFKAHVFVNILKELKLLVRGMIGCVRTLTWSLVLTFIFLTSWSVVAVELVHPLMQSVQDTQQVWKDCERCVRSFSTVMGSNLTFFQTIVAGDSWGKVAIPVIEMYPWTGIIFVGTLFTLIFGMLNLVIAVLVDSAAEARAGDTELRARQAEEQRKKERKALEKIFKKIDLDESGALSFEELQQGAQDVPEFRDRLKVMAIDDDDLHQMFVMCDEDGSGEVDPDEFIETLYRLKCSDHAVAATFVKHYVLHMNRNHQLLQNKVDELCGLIKKQAQSSVIEGKVTKNGARNGTGEEFVVEQSNASHLHGFRGEWTPDPELPCNPTITTSDKTLSQALHRASWTSNPDSLPNGTPGFCQVAASPQGLPKWRGFNDQAGTLARALVIEPPSIACQEEGTLHCQEALSPRCPEVSTPRSPIFTPRQVSPPSTEMHDIHLGRIEKSFCEMHDIDLGAKQGLSK